jgi:LPS export ABC transporter protein LptC
MKSRVRLLVILSAILLLVALAGLVGRALWQQGQARLAQQAIELLPEVAQRIQDFHRVFVRDGRKVWEIAAREARYFEDEQRVVVRGPMVEFYLDDGRSVGLKGEEGVVSLEGKDVRQVELSGGIEVRLAEYTVWADYARYDRDHDRIEAPGAVRISGAELDVAAEGLQVDVEAQKMRLTRDVRMTLHPTGGSSGRAL